jgi:hypothetical protein
MYVIDMDCVDGDEYLQAIPAAQASYDIGLWSTMYHVTTNTYLISFYRTRRIHCFNRY